LVAGLLSSWVNNFLRASVAIFAMAALPIPAVAVPTVNPDNNQHSPNENIRLGNYVDGIKTIAAILMEKL
jgi:acetylornithine deacetylase/succinyl-diaminopimelate desuccinylase-like protein